jgi:hypothetical protein
MGKQPNVDQQWRIDELDEEWVDAHYQLEQARPKNKKPIFDMIENSGLPKVARMCLIDLIDRNFPPPPLGRKRTQGKLTPVYMVSKSDWMWWEAYNEVQFRIERGDPEKDALAKVAAKIGRTDAQLKSKLDHSKFDRSFHSVTGRGEPKINPLLLRIKDEE